MRSTWKTCIAALLTCAGASFGQLAGWSGDFVPQSMELTPTYNSADGTEGPTLLVVYLNGTSYVAPLNGEKVKGWSDMIRSAIQAGKKVNIFWDSSYLPSHTFCSDYDYYGACVGFTTANLRRIQRLSLKSL